MTTVTHSLLIASSITVASLLSMHASAADEKVVRPAVMSQQEINSSLQQHPQMVVEKRADGSQALDVTSLLSSDKKFVTGMYEYASAGHHVVTEPYGVDEYMYFLKGSLTLTSSDGTVTEIKAGDSVTLPKEWTGTWDTPGYTKIYVIYSPDAPIE